MVLRTLVSTAVLAQHLSDSSLAIVDCRFRLDDTSWGEREYADQHVPGAVYAHLDRDLSGAVSGTNGRHPLPDPDTLTKTFGRLGIGAETRVVAYDQDSGMYASRLWWLLRWLGHEQVAVLDGGFARWAAESRPTAAGLEPRTRCEFSGKPDRRMLADGAEVHAWLHDGSHRLVDARAPDRFRGEHETLDKAAGHIPGAVNHFFRWNLGEDGRFLTPDDLRRRFRAVVGDTPSDWVVCYCGSGVTACHNLLAMAHGGLTGAKLYPGSWSEWSSDPARPVEQGPGADLSSVQARRTDST